MAEWSITKIILKNYEHPSLFVTELQEIIKGEEMRLITAYKEIEIIFRSASKDPIIETAKYKLKEKINAMYKIEQLCLLESEHKSGSSIPLAKSATLVKEYQQSSDAKDVSDNVDDKNEKNEEGEHLLVTGVSGTGVTSTRQSIFLMPPEKKGLSKNGTIECSKDATTFNEKNITVTECPGYMLKKTLFEALNCSIGRLKEGLEICEYTFKGLIIVLKYGERVSSDFIMYIKLIKGILGEDVIKNHGVFVFTCGDKYPHLSKKKFLKWCMKQNVVKDIFSECGYRCVLFDNVATDNSKKTEQVRELLSYVNQLKTYSVNDFKEAKESYEFFAFEVLEEYIVKKIGSIYPKKKDRKWFKSKIDYLPETEKFIDFVKNILKNCPYKNALLTELQAKEDEITKDTAGSQNDNPEDLDLKYIDIENAENINKDRWESLKDFFTSVFSFLGETFRL